MYQVCSLSRVKALYRTPVQCVGMMGRALGDPKYDWGFTTVPQRYLNDRSLYHARGRLLGGSSAVCPIIQMPTSTLMLILRMPTAQLLCLRSTIQRRAGRMGDAGEPRLELGQYFEVHEEGQP